MHGRVQPLNYRQVSCMEEYNHSTIDKCHAWKSTTTQLQTSVMHERVQPLNYRQVSCMEEYNHSTTDKCHAWKSITTQLQTSVVSHSF